MGAESWLARPAAGAALLAGALALLGGLGGERASGERAQHGELVVSLRGGVSPPALPRRGRAPVTVRLSGSAWMANGGLLPRLTELEIDLPNAGAISTRGLPSCERRQLLNRKSYQALEACRAALVGSGSLAAKVILPNQTPFTLHARLLVFNGRSAGGRPSLLLHGYAQRPPVAAVVPFVMHRRPHGFRTYFVARLPRALGPWPHVASFSLRLGRRYAYRGRPRSFISASCPLPPRFTAGFLTLARVRYTLEGGESASVEMVRGCRAR